MRRVKLEVADVPVMYPEVRTLNRNYDLLPDGYEDILLRVESRDEILADKVVAFACAPYVRHRDLWDMPWLMRRGAKLNSAMVQGKLTAYGSDGFDQTAKERITAIPQIMKGQVFHDEITSFLTQRTREETFGRLGFVDSMSGALEELYGEVQGVG